jgi:hypothetical protein
MGYSFDGSTTTTIVDATSINATVTAANGAHTLHVKAWGEGGGSCDTDVVLSVTSPANAAVVPSGAISVSAIQALSNWQAINDTGAIGLQRHSTSVCDQFHQRGGRAVLRFLRRRY